MPPTQKNPNSALEWVQIALDSSAVHPTIQHAPNRREVRFCRCEGPRRSTQCSHDSERTVQRRAVLGWTRENSRAAEQTQRRNNSHVFPPPMCKGLQDAGPLDIWTTQIQEWIFCIGGTCQKQPRATRRAEPGLSSSGAGIAGGLAGTWEATTPGAFCIFQALGIQAASLPIMSLKRAARGMTPSSGIESGVVW